MAAVKGYESCTCQSRISQRWSIGDGSGGPVNGVCHDQQYSEGIVLLEEKNVSNSPIDWQDMWVKDFLHIALACKYASNYM